ncbi:MAG: hypothetical protein L0170_03170, partial [Acidobacteria bacterium]|nr:hypothetical protein [Acidobacteriota bacterium]
MFFVLVLLFTSSLAASAQPPPDAAPVYPEAPAGAPKDLLAPGTLHDRIATAEDPSHSYALYLPSDYSPDRRWPVLYAFDPAARG